MNATVKMLAHWNRASTELGFRFVSPFLVQVEGAEVEAFGYVPDFGNVKGTVLFTPENESGLASAREQGFYCSCLYANDRAYDPDDIASTLDDWGWYGVADETPRWYTGRPWTS